MLMWVGFPHDWGRFFKRGKTVVKNILLVWGTGGCYFRGKLLLNFLFMSFQMNSLYMYWEHISGLSEEDFGCCWGNRFRWRSRCFVTWPSLYSSCEKNILHGQYFMRPVWFLVRVCALILMVRRSVFFGWSMYPKLVVFVFFLVHLWRWIDAYWPNGYFEDREKLGLNSRFVFYPRYWTYHM